MSPFAAILFGLSFVNLIIASYFNHLRLKLNEEYDQMDKDYRIRKVDNSKEDST